MKDAAKILQGLTLLDGSISYVFTLLESINQKEEHYETAIEQYTKALILDPHDAYCLTNRGEIFLRQGKFQEASTDLLKAMDTDPDKKHPAANRARLLLALANDAVKALDTVRS